ncbi:MAG: FAD-dependent oxidoreductase [Candidatus Omnitrophota bacterium]
MKEVRAVFIERIDRTPTVASFRFQPNEKVTFIPGQFLQVIFDGQNKNNKDLNKYLSFSASPDKAYIEVTKRLSTSMFSQKLSGLKNGDEVMLKLPLGNCTLRPEYKKVAFLIGGIGITPVISIVEYACQRQLDIDIALFYSNKSYEEIAFKKELDTWQKQYDHLKVFYTLTACESQYDDCRFGYIDSHLLQTALADISSRVFFIFGPPKMVEAMNKVCIEAGCGKENIKTESFLGY